RVEQVEQRQIAAAGGLPQPLLAKRPGAEGLDVGHVRVQDDRQRATLASAPARAARRPAGARIGTGVAHGRQTATKSSARSRSAVPAGRSLKSVAAIAGVKRS